MGLIQSRFVQSPLVNRVGLLKPAALALPSLSYVTTSTSTSNLTTYSFADISIGAADATRRVIVVCQWASNANNRSLSSVSINSTGATIHVSANNFAAVGIASLLLAAGTTTDISFTLSGGAQNGSVSVYRLVNETSSSPHATGTDTTLSGATVSAAINVPGDGCVVAGVTTGGGGSSISSWTGATENYDTQLESDPIYSGASATGLSAETPRTISATANSDPIVGVLAALSWG